MRTWRKLHLVIDENHNVLACELTTPEVGDPTAVPNLLDQIDTPFDKFMGDGAYDGDPVSQAVLSKQPNAQVVIPPHKTAVLSAGGNTQRDEHIKTIASKGRIAWQQKSGYNLRNLVELTQKYGYKCHATLQTHLRKHNESAFTSTTKNGSLDQRIGTKPDDRFRHACVCKNLKTPLNG